jgi:phenylacetate-coenzyme A ligase PaaK-like adenylate-forming protein
MIITAPDVALLRARTTAALAGRLPDHARRLRWDCGQLAAFQRCRLRELLARAIRGSPFHAGRLAGIDPGRFELADLPQLPVMTKTQMMANFDQVVTDRRLTRDLVNRHLAGCGNDPALLLGDFVCLVSGGSSGLRGLFVQTLDEYSEFGATVTRRPFARLMALGEPPPGGVTIGMVGAASPVHSSGFGSVTITGPPLGFVSIPATLPTAELVERLNAVQPAALTGYASRLALLAREQRAGRLRLAPWSVTSMGEMLTPQDRDAITGAFGVPVTNMFASTEGLVGHSEPGGGVLTFASDTCIAECVDQANRPVAAGTPSAKVLVTNLHNLTQPLIRYELTDRFTPAAGGPGGWLRAEVDGRADDIFRYGAAEVHPHAVTSVLVKAAAVTEYQVRQTVHGAEITAVADGDFDRAAVTAAVEASLRRAGVREPLVTLGVASSIARDPKTGKIRRFIPLSAD